MFNVYSNCICPMEGGYWLNNYFQAALNALGSGKPSWMKGADIQINKVKLCINTVIMTVELAGNSSPASGVTCEDLYMEGSIMREENFHEVGTGFSRCKEKMRK